MRRRSLLDKIEQVVRLIRSKGVGVYFVTQNPLDVPETVLGQLGNRVQHALRAFTPRDQKAVKAAAETMRANPKLDTEKAITELAVGEALVSFLDAKGRPEIVERAYVLPPGGRIGPATPEERQRVMAGSGLAGVYDKPVDRESAYERLKGRAEAARRRPARAPAAHGGSWTDSIKDSLGGLLSGSGRKDSIVEAVGEERGANGRLDDRARNRPRRAGLAAGRPPALSVVRGTPVAPIAPRQSPISGARSTGACRATGRALFTTSRAPGRPRGIDAASLGFSPSGTTLARTYAMAPSQPLARGRTPT